MLKRLVGLGTTVLLTVCTAPAFGFFTDGAADLSSQFTLSSSTQVPGKVLKPGQYTIRVLDHLSDRVIVRIESEAGKSEGIFLALPNSSLSATSGNGPISWQGGPQKALRGYGFSGGSIEFVYPKEEAVEIAKKNPEKVPAIDPKSEGRPAANKLNSEDREMVTLWMLSSTRVGPPNEQQAAIAAEKYVAPPAAVVQTAQASPSQLPAPSSIQANSRSPHAKAARQRAQPLQVAALDRPVLPKNLPHTASDLPLVFAASFVLLGLAGGVNRIRKVTA